MKDIKHLLERDFFFKQVALLAKNEKRSCFLVGGFLRDLILNRKKRYLDYDFAVDKDAIAFGKKLAHILKAGFVVLDELHGSCRVVYNKKTIVTLDFTDFRGRDIREDSFKRDFTANCLSVDCLDKSLTMLDPVGALRDIKLKVVRQANMDSIKEDPLRILRAFSLSAIFGFSIESSTLLSIRKNKNLLVDCAYERIREEFFKILEADKAFGIIKALDKEKILTLIIQEIKSCYKVDQGPYHHLDVWEHSLRTLVELEDILRKNRNPQIKEHLSKEVAQNHNKYQLIKLAALLHDIGKPPAKKRYKGKLIFHGHEMLGSKIVAGIASRLKLSLKESDYLRRIVWMHLRPGYLADLENLSKRAIFRFFRDAQDEALDILLVSLADQRATRGPLNTVKSRLNHERLCAKLIREFLRSKKQKPFKRLINGDDLIKLKIPESPLIGKILKELEELQAEKRITKKTDAFNIAKKLYLKFKGKK